MKKGKKQNRMDIINFETQGDVRRAGETAGPESDPIPPGCQALLFSGLMPVERRV